MALAVALGLGALATPASADVTYQLNYYKSGGAIVQTTSFGTVVLHQKTSTEIVVTVSLDTAGGVSFANTGAGYAITWDMVGDTATHTLPITVQIDPATPNYSSTILPFQADAYSYQGYKASPFSSGTNGNYYDYAVSYNGPTGCTEPHCQSQLIFDVTSSGGPLLFSNFVGADKYVFGVDIIDHDLRGSPTFVVASLPEPGTVALFMAGLVGLGLFQIKRFRKSTAA